MSLYLDPGTKGIGWAQFTGEALTACGLALTTQRELYLALSSLVRQIPRDADVWVEEMTVRGEADERYQPKDLLRVQWMGAAVGAAVAYPGLPHPVQPRTWKGSTPKAIHQPRIVKALTPAERGVMDRDLADVRPSLRHNAVDAIGIGLWRVGRRA